MPDQVDAHLGEVDGDAIGQKARGDCRGRQMNRVPGRRVPGVDAGVRLQQVVVADSGPIGQFDKGFSGAGDVVLRRSDDGGVRPEDRFGFQAGVPGAGVGRDQQEDDEDNCARHARDYSGE